MFVQSDEYGRMKLGLHATLLTLPATLTTVTRTRAAMKSESCYWIVKLKGKSHIKSDIIFVCPTIVNAKMFLCLYRVSVSCKY